MRTFNTLLFHLNEQMITLITKLLRFVVVLAKGRISEPNEA